MKDLFVTYLLDRSGSMQTIWSDTLGGLDGFFKEQAALPGTAWVSLYAFDAQGFDTVYEAWNAQDIPSLLDDDKGLYPRSMTPLLDSIAKAVEATEQALSDRPWFDGEVLVAIQTDGYENTSREHTKASIKDLISRKESEGWTFAFMGAGIDAVDEGTKFGVAAGQSFSYTPDSVGTRSAYNTLSGAVTGLRSAGKFEVDSDSKT